MKLRIILVASLLFVVTAGISQKKEKEQSWDTVDALVESGEFHMEFIWAIAQGSNSMNAIAGSNLQPPGSAGNRFSLINTPNKLDLKDEVVTAYLPYFGEQQFGNGHYSGQTAIEFDDVPKELTVTKNEKKKRYDITFHINRDTEIFQVNIKLFQNLKCQMVVNSNQRFPIRYEGKISALPAEGEGSSK